MIVAGIIVFAVGVKLMVRGRVGSPLPEPARLAMCGGVALYLLGHVAFRMRMVGSIGYEKVAVGVALFVLYALGGGLPAWSIAAAVAALMAALCVIETADAYRAERPTLR